MSEKRYFTLGAVVATIVCVVMFSAPIIGVYTGEKLLQSDLYWDHQSISGIQNRETGALAVLFLMFVSFPSCLFAVWAVQDVARNRSRAKYYILGAFLLGLTVVLVIVAIILKSFVF